MRKKRISHPNRKKMKLINRIKKNPLTRTLSEETKIMWRAPIQIVKPARKKFQSGSCW
jgi:hypothetical protein